MELLEQFLYIDDSYANDESKAILVYLDNLNHVRVMLPNEEFEKYCFAQHQDDCTDAVANYLEEFDGDSLSEEEIVKILLSLEK